MVIAGPGIVIAGPGIVIAGPGIVIAGPDPQSMARVALDPGSSPG